MKKSKKISIIVGVIMILAGLAVSFFAVAAMNFDFRKMNTFSFDAMTYWINDDFLNVSVDGGWCGVNIYPSDDDRGKVVVNVVDGVESVIAVKGDTLDIKWQDNRKWFEKVGLYWGETDISIYLPKKEYNMLNVQSTSGDVEVAEDVTFSSINIETTSGDVKVSNISCKKIVTGTKSGEVYLTDVITSGDIQITSVSGDVTLDHCDGDNIKIKTSSGDVYGTLLSEKIFKAETSSGDINIPNSSSGGSCDIATSSGDIKFSVK